LLGLFALAILVFGVGTADAADGKEVFLAQKCNLCHTVSSADIEATTKSDKMLGPDLSAVEAHDPAWLAKYLKQEETRDGEKHKKAFKGTDEELQALIAWLNEQAEAGG
jgi:mono/diheme cytochrome c family protein